MDDDIDNFVLGDLELLLSDVDVAGKPGIFWTLVGTAAVLSLFVVTAVWRFANRIRHP